MLLQVFQFFNMLIKRPAQMTMRLVCSIISADKEQQSTYKVLNPCQKAWVILYIQSMLQM